MSMLNKKVESKYVKKAFLVKFGNLFVIPEVEDYRKVNYKVLEENIMKCLSDSPSIKKIRKIDKPTKESGGVARVRKEPTGPVLKSVALHHPIRAEIGLPVKNQLSAAFMLGLHGDRVDLTTDFSILYNASIYAIFREVDLSRAPHPGIIDIRNFFQSVVERESSWRTKFIGPTPLRQDFFFVYLVDNKNSHEYVGKMFVKESELYLYLSEARLKKFEELLATILYLSNLDEYYSAMFQLQRLDNCVENLTETHTSIQSIISSSLKLSFFNVLTHYRNSKELEKLIAKHYSGLLDYNSNLELLREEIADAEEVLRKDLLLSPFVTKLMKELEHEKIDMETLTKCASYAREVIQKSYTTKVTLLGALIGILGTLVGTLVLHYLGV